MFVTLGRHSEPIEDVVEPLLGYRWWRVNDNGQLFSVMRSRAVSWPTNGLVARCGDIPPLLAELFGRRPPCVDHLRPFFLSSDGPPCGIYAYNDLRFAYGKFHGEVFGEVLMAGRVIPHERGYRSQKAKISKLFLTHRALLHPRTEQRACLAGDRYDVPVEFLPEHELR